MYKLIKSTELETYKDAPIYEDLKLYLTNQKLISQNMIHTEHPVTLIFYANEEKVVMSNVVKLTGESKMKDLPRDKFFIVNILKSEKERMRLMILDRMASEDKEFTDEEMHKISENLIYRYTEVKEYLEDVV